MGYSLAWQAGHPYWLGLLPSYVDRIVLTRMALIALDPDTRNGSGMPPFLYFAGREPLMLALSETGQLPAEDTNEYEALRKKVQRSIRRLEKAGALTEEVRSKGGKPSRYRLTLGASLIGFGGQESVPQ